MGGLLPPVTEGIGAVTSALHLLKELRGVEASLDKAELKLRIAEVADQLLDAKEHLQDAQKQIEKQEAEIVRLGEALDFHGSLVEHHGHLYEADTDGKPMGPAFCPVCIEPRRSHIRIDGTFREKQCPLCKSSFKDAQYFLYPDQKGTG